MPFNFGIGGGIAGMRQHGSGSWPITRRIVSTYSHWQMYSIAAWSNSIGVMAPHADFAAGGRAEYPRIHSGVLSFRKKYLAAALAIARCKRGERSLLLSYEESLGQLIQNMSSIGFYFET